MIRTTRHFVFYVKNCRQLNQLNNVRTITLSVSPGRSSGRILRNQLEKCENIIHTNSQANRLFTSYTTVISQLDYENICDETLESLSDYFEELVENSNELAAADVLNKDGVLTVSLAAHGTYVINKQSPNKQIWLSSPISGPKRFDFVFASKEKMSGYWIYKHTGETLHELLDKELSPIVKSETHFQELSFGSEQ